MGVGAFEMIDSPAAALTVQTYQLPMQSFNPDGTSNAAVMGRIGTSTGATRFLFVGVQLRATDSAGTTVLDVVGASLESTVSTLPTSAGSFEVHREANRRGVYRWVL